MERWEIRDVSSGKAGFWSSPQEDGCGLGDWRCPKRGLGLSGWEGPGQPGCLGHFGGGAVAKLPVGPGDLPEFQLTSG